MRIWDVPVAELDDRALLAEHRELHGLYEVATRGKRGYASHPETLRWKGRLRALARRHDDQVAEFKRRGWPSGDSHATPIDRSRLGRKESTDPPLPLIPIAEQRRILARKAAGRRPSGVRYLVVEGAEGAALAMELRFEVFVREQDVPPEIEPDELDALAVHAIARTGAGVIATGRLVVESGHGRIGRLAVARAFRGRGLGRAILERLLREAARRDLGSVRLHAQCHARDFYARAGFRDCSPVFLEAGIEHIEMERRLRPARPQAV